MEAIVYTRDDKEYNLIKTILENEAELIDIDRHPLNGHKRYDHGYDVAVVALKGAEVSEPETTTQMEEISSIRTRSISLRAMVLSSAINHQIPVSQP